MSVMSFDDMLPLIYMALMGATGYLETGDPSVALMT